MAYYVFLGELPLPVTPGALTISTPSGNKTIRLINDGEINILKEPGLQEIAFDFLLPQRSYPFVNFSVAKNYTATEYIPLLNAMNKSKQPFQFIVTRMNPNGEDLNHTNIKVAMGDLTFDEDAASLGMDIKCSIQLKGYKEYGVRRFSILNVVSTAVSYAAAAGTVIASGTTSRSTASKTTPKTYTVKSGDTLWNICKKHLGDGQKYKEIAELNKLENPDKIYPGQVLRLS